MNVKQWQKRLEDTFNFNGLVGGQLQDIFQCEKECGDIFVNTFHGQSVLIDSFQGFVITTINLSADYIVKYGWPTKCDNYSATILYFIMMFRRVRACEILLLNGYPLDGYALLRDLKDRAIFLAALAHNLTTWNALSGYGPGVLAPTSGIQLTVSERRVMVNNKKKEEHRLLNMMIGNKSDLDLQAIHILEKWEQLFHKEVHGAQLSFFTELGDWANGKSVLSIGPIPKLEPMGMYMNRISEIGWLITRLLPYLQPAPNAFGEEWLKQWRILDESFLYMEQALSQDGKEIGDAFIAFVNTKFHFNDPFFYSEPNGLCSIGCK